MKSKLFLAALIITSALFITSCSKDETAPQSPTIQGYWEGKFGEGNEVPNQFYGILFKTGGSVRVYSTNTDTTTAIKKDGIYNLQDGIVNIVYDDEGTFATGIVDANFTKITTGTWGFAPSNNNGGTFFLDKK